MNLPIPGMLIAGPEGEQTLRLDEVVGAGAFGDVWKALEVSSGVSFAVKFPRVLSIGTGDKLTAFRNEVEAAKEIQHANVVPVVHVEASPVDFPPYLVMEFVEGGTLRDRLEQYRDANRLVPLELVQAWTEGLVDGIAAVNEHMLHRDLRPENVLMKGDTPLIGDFGLSKVVEAITRSKTFKGRQHVLYMAPEGWKLQSNRVQLDMYAMGIVLFEMATLQYPYDLPEDPWDLEGVMSMHLFGHPRSVQDLHTDLPVGYSHLISRLLEKRPEDRFEDWSQVSQALCNVWHSSMPDSEPRAQVVDSLLRITQRIHDIETEQRLDGDRRARDLEEQRRLDELQVKKLVGVIVERVQQFNRASSLGSIGLREAGQELEYYFDLPFGGPLYLGFGPVDPPLRLRVGEVRLAGLVADRDRAGLNFLLCRKDKDDLYGKWKVCRVTQRIGLDPAKLPPRAEPFGFNGPSLREIEIADDANHVYVTDFSNDVEDALLQVAADAMERHASLSGDAK